MNKVIALFLAANIAAPVLASASQLNNASNDSVSAASSADLVSAKDMAGKAMDKLNDSAASDPVALNIILDDSEQVPLEMQPSKVLTAVSDKKPAFPSRSDLAYEYIKEQEKWAKEEKPGVLKQLGLAIIDPILMPVAGAVYGFKDGKNNSGYTVAGIAVGTFGLLVGILTIPVAIIFDVAQVVLPKEKRTSAYKLIREAFSGPSRYPRV